MESGFRQNPEMARQAAERAAAMRAELARQHLEKEAKPKKPTDTERNQKAVEEGQEAKKFLNALEQGPQEGKSH